MLKGIFNSLFKSKPILESAHIEAPFKIFDTYLHHIKDDIDENKIDDSYNALHETSFKLSTELGSPSHQFNMTVAPFFNLPSFTHSLTCAGEFKNEVCLHNLTYKGQTVSWQEKPTRLSDEFEVFIMAKLLDDDVEIRLDTSSISQSECYWFILPSEIWMKLEVKYGQDFVRRHFEPVPDNFGEPNHKFELLDNSLL